jgi:two-component system cell cycle response regulator DivK
MEDVPMAKAIVLIVEDTLDIALTLADAFRFAGFTVQLAPDAVQALQLASEFRPNIIIMDIQLPDLDGLSTAETLKRDPATRHIPIIAMTAHAIEGHQAKILSRTCAGYCQKPVRPRDLITLATAVLSQPPHSGPKPPRPMASAG